MSARRTLRAEWLGTPLPARLPRPARARSGLPLAARTARQVAQYLSTMLEAAVADGLIARNPAHGAKRPSVDDEPVVPFTDDEVDASPGGVTRLVRRRAHARARRRAAPERGVRAHASTGSTSSAARSPSTASWSRRRRRGSRRSGRRRRSGPTARCRSPIAVVAEAGASRRGARHRPGRAAVALRRRAARPAPVLRCRSGASCASDAGLPDAHGSTTRATRTPRCCCPAACRWRRQPSTSGTVRRCC